MVGPDIKCERHLHQVPQEPELAIVSDHIEDSELLWASLTAKGRVQRIPSHSQEKRKAGFRTSQDKQAASHGKGK